MKFSVVDKWARDFLYKRLPIYLQLLQPIKWTFSVLIIITNVLNLKQVSSTLKLKISSFLNKHYKIILSPNIYNSHLSTTKKIKYLVLSIIFNITIAIINETS